MENFAPGLKDAVMGLSHSLRFVVFFIAVAGLMLQVHQARQDWEGMARPLVKSIFIIGLVATLPQWFGWIEQVFLHLANLAHTGYTEHPMRAAVILRESVTENPADFDWAQIGESFYRATLWALAKLVVLLASLVQLPFLLLQYILKLLCYLFLPVAFGLLLIPTLSSTGSRYIQQTLAVLSWPAGFAVTELVAYHLITAYQQNLAAAYGIAPGDITAASFASLLGGLLGALWLILGTLGTPFLMQALICSGAPLTSGTASGLQQLYALQQIMWMIKSVKTAGAALPAMLAQSATGRHGGPKPPSPPAVFSGPMQSTGHTGNLPGPQTTI